MVNKKPKVVIIGAGMAGLTAANKLYTTQKIDLCVVEGGNRIGGRIKTSEFCGSRIEMGATWIHGIGGSPVYKIAQEINSLESEKSWECMDELLDEALTVTEGGHVINSSLVDPISNLFKKLMDFAQGKVTDDDGLLSEFAKGDYLDDAKNNLSVGSFLRKGLKAYWSSRKGEDSSVQGIDNWSRESLEEGIFAMLENTQRTYTSADDLETLDFNAEREYRMFPGKEITIAKGYSSVIESLASVLPHGLIQLGRKVTKIEWQSNDGGHHQSLDIENDEGTKPVKLHFVDGSVMYADHVIVTVSLGVLKQAVSQDSGMFCPPLPSFKTQAISRLGFGVVNKVFLKLTDDGIKFPNMQMVFHQSDSKVIRPAIPWWMRRTSSLCPIYERSNVLLAWFVGKEALELESLDDNEIINGFFLAISNFLPNSHSPSYYSDSFSSNKFEVGSQSQPKPKHESCNGHDSNSNGRESLIKFDKVLKSQWGKDPLFLGSYSYVAAGSSGDDLDALAEPLPKMGCNSKVNCNFPQLQILFAGEATHRTHYSTTHGAYFSGLREANRLLQHYHFI